jgi:hypothetical protein
LRHDRWHRIYRARRSRASEFSHRLQDFCKSGWTQRPSGLRFAEDMTKSNPQNRIIGYARVSTYGQTLDAQLEQLKAAGCAKVYKERATGAQVERRELQRMLKTMASGDVVTVTRIDRLARSTFDLFSIVKGIADAGGHCRFTGTAWLH